MYSKTMKNIVFYDRDSSIVKTCRLAIFDESTFNIPKVEKLYELFMKYDYERV